MQQLLHTENQGAIQLDVTMAYKVVFMILNGSIGIKELNFEDFQDQFIKSVQDRSHTIDFVNSTDDNPLPDCPFSRLLKSFACK